MQQPHRKEIIDELMNSSEEEMQITIDALEQELENLEDDTLNIMTLMNEMEEAEKILRKAFLKDREKYENASSEEQTEALLAQLDGSEEEGAEKKRKKVLGLF